jgi:hypothetical protein
MLVEKAREMNTASLRVRAQGLSLLGRETTIISCS